MTPTDASEVVPYLSSAATIVYVQAWLKERDLYKRFVAAFPGADEYAHWAIAGAMSLFVAAGIHFVWNGDLVKGGDLTIHIPDWQTLLHGVSDWGKVYVLQHTVYRATNQPAYQPKEP